MQIGAVAEASGVSAKMIRHYEAIGLIASGARRANGYRDYDERDSHELRFIRSARDLGFSLDEIRTLLDLWRNKNRTSRDVHELAARHLADIDRKIGELQSIATTLRNLLSACHDDGRPDCPILSGLSGKEIDGGGCRSKPENAVEDQAVFSGRPATARTLVHQKR